MGLSSTTSSPVQRETPDTVEGSLLAARAGDESMLGRLLEVYRGYLLTIANDEIGTDMAPKMAPSDLVQETFLQAYRDFPKFQGGAEYEVRDWLKTILINNLRDAHRHYRGTQKRQLNLERPWESVLNDETNPGNLVSAESPSRLLCATEAMRALQASLTRLPEEYRRIIQRRNFDGIGFEDLAAEFGRTPGAIRKLWGRAVKKLAEELYRDGVD